ncbi:DUF1467 family protein [Rhodobacteraceae bacterium NNCM2]|nr:DUF1467 family protein [Coraliihabitans acroporae]
MSFTSGIVLYVVIWALIFYMVNPLWQRSQSEEGEIVPGTPPGAPVDGKFGLKAVIVTGLAAVVFGLVFSVIYFHLVSLEDLSIVTPPSMR